MGGKAIKISLETRWVRNGDDYATDSQNYKISVDQQEHLDFAVEALRKIMRDSIDQRPPPSNFSKTIELDADEFEDVVAEPPLELDVIKEGDEKCTSEG